MYIVAWSVFTSEGEIPYWEIVDGEDAMQIRVNELIDDGCSEDEIIVGSVIENN
jgi:hypothetical protein